MLKNLKIRVCVCLALLLFGTLFGFLVLLSTQLPNETAFAAQNLLRLHVIAHSNTPRDQDLKLVVRDAILAEAKGLFADVQDKAEAQNLVEKSKRKIQEIAQDTIYAAGFSYPVQVQVGYYPFPERTYGAISLPEGYYDAVRVEIGEARGENWWCVLFPPLCLSDLEDDHSSLLKVNQEGSKKGLVLRSKFWEHMAQTSYAKAFQKWWQASAASYPSLTN